MIPFQLLCIQHFIMTQLAGVFLFVSIILSCNRQAAKHTLPQCVESKIRELSDLPPAEPRRQIISYDYHGNTVFYVSAPCCDQMSELFDLECRLLCRPDGGFTGKGDGRCADFNEMKSNPVLIWKDNR